MKISLKTIIGLSLSFSWMAFWYGYYLNRVPAEGLALNNMGDFLAGVMSPLALFWLVIGYFQQGEELQQNTKALLAQEEELSKQAKAMDKLAESTTAQLHHVVNKENLEAKPVFIFTGHSKSSDIRSYNIKNIGGEINNLRIEQNPNNLDITVNRDRLSRDEMFKISLRGHVEESFFCLSCNDKLNNQHKLIFSLDDKGKLSFDESE